METTGNKSDRINDSISKLAELIRGEPSLTPEQAEGQGYVLGADIPLGDLGDSWRRQRLVALTRAGKVDRVRVKDAGRYSFWYKICD